MANDRFADPTDLAGMSRGVNPLEDAGYDPDELRANPALRAQVMEQMRSLYGPSPAGDVPGEASGGARSLANRAPARPAPPAMVRTPAAVALPQAPQPQGVGTTGNGGRTVTQGAPVPLDPMTTEALGGGLRSAGEQEDVGRQLAASGDEQAAETDALEMQRSADAVPTPLYDARGRMLPDYKPGIGQRILRGVRGAIVGGVTGGIPGAIVGAMEPQDIRGGQAYGAPNRAYGIAEENRQTRLAADTQNLQDVRDRFKAMLANRQAASTALGSSVKGYTDTAGDIAKAQDASTKAATELRNAQENSPEGKAAAQTAIDKAKFDQRQAQADRIFGKGRGGEQRELYMLNGKVPDPRQATAEEVARGQALKAFRQQYGRGPVSLDEINRVNAAAAGRMKEEMGGGALPPEAGQIVADEKQAEKDFMGTLTRMASGSYLDPNGKILKPAEVQAKLDALRRAANPKLTKYGAVMDTATGELRQMGGGAPASAQGEPNPGEAGAAAAPVRHFNGHPYRQDKKTGKWILASGG